MTYQHSTNLVRERMQRAQVQMTLTADAAPCIPAPFLPPMPAALLDSGETIPQNGARCAARVRAVLPADPRGTQAPG